MNSIIYKILTEAQWNQFQKLGTFAGTPHDIKDGFIHLCEENQMEGVISRYYADLRPLYVVEFSAEVFGNSLRWEKASNGEVFPHVYDRELRLSEGQLWNTFSI